MNHRIRNWSAGGVFFLALGAGAWLWHSSANRLANPAATRAAEQPSSPRAVTDVPAAVPATTPARKGAAAVKKAEPTAEGASPFLPGETLEFTAHLAKLNNVAALQLVVDDRRTFLGRVVWHLKAFAHTQNPLRMVLPLDDQFDSYSDAATLASLQYELHLNERGQKVDTVLRMTTGNEPAPADATAARVLPGTRDPLGMMQYLRTVDWTKTPEVRSPVFDGHKLYDVRARFVSASEHVAVPAGEFPASKIELRVFEGGVEAKDTRFALYLANTPPRMPVLLEAVLPFATARVELLRAQ